MEDEEKALKFHLQSIRSAKRNLTSNLTALECRHLSSDDEIISTDDVDSTYDTADDFDDNEGYAMTFDHPVLPPKQLEHLTKRRASVPSSKRPPAKYKAILDVKQSEQTTNLTDQCEQNRTLMTCQSSCEMTSSIVFPSSMESSYISLPGLPNVEVDDEIMV